MYTQLDTNLITQYAPDAVLVALTIEEARTLVAGGQPAADLLAAIVASTAANVATWDEEHPPEEG